MHNARWQGEKALARSLGVVTVLVGLALALSFLPLLFWIRPLMEQNARGGSPFGAPVAVVLAWGQWLFVSFVLMVLGVAYAAVGGYQAARAERKVSHWLSGIVSAVIAVAVLGVGIGARASEGFAEWLLDTTAISHGLVEALVVVVMGVHAALTLVLGIPSGARPSRTRVVAAATIALSTIALGGVLLTS